jgi:hypothetical protein
MDLLSTFQAPEPRVDDKPKRGTWLVEIRDEKTKQSLVVEHDEPLEAYVFVDPEVAKAAGREAAAWKEGERHAEGILVGELDGEYWVCFVELKQSLEYKDANKQEPSEHGFDQLAGSSEHFHPTPGSHGRDHHDQWVNETDPLEVVPVKNHRVVGLLVALRRMATPPPSRALRLGDTQVPLRALRLPMNEPNRNRTTFRDLLEQARVLRPAK